MHRLKRVHVYVLQNNLFQFLESKKKKKLGWENSNWVKHGNFEEKLHTPKKYVIQYKAINNKIQIDEEQKWTFWDAQKVEDEDRTLILIMGVEHEFYKVTHSFICLHCI